MAWTVWLWGAVAATPELLADLFELMMFEMAKEVEGKCYYIVFYWR